MSWLNEAKRVTYGELVRNRPVTSFNLQLPSPRREFDPVKDNDLTMIAFPPERWELTHTPFVTFEEPQQRYEGYENVLPSENTNTIESLNGFLERLLPQDEITAMVKEPLIRFLSVMSKDFYDKYLGRDRIHRSNKRRVKLKNLPEFANVRGSAGFGGAFDRMYGSIGDGFRVSAMTNVNANENSNGRKENIQTAINRYLSSEAVTMASSSGRDLDIAFNNTENVFNPLFIINGWAKSRVQYTNPEMKTGDDGIISYSGINYQVKERVLLDGSLVYDGWKFEVEGTDDASKIVTLQIGTFTAPNGFRPNKEDTLCLINRTFAVSFSSQPLIWSEQDDLADRRGGLYVSTIDCDLRLGLKSKTRNGKNISVNHPELDYNLNRYNRWMMYEFIGDSIFRDRSRLVEVFSRGVKQMSAKVGFFGLHKSFSDVCEKEFDASLWEGLSVENWRGDLVYNILAAAHLSPITLALNLIPDSKLDMFPKDLQEKAAQYGQDHTFSFGNLWPDIFRNMPDEMIIKFIRAMPDQAEYVKSYLDNPNILTNQGLYFILHGLKQAGVEFPDFGGNMMLQAMYVFRHPEDSYMDSLTVLIGIRQILDSMGEKTNKLYPEVLNYQREKLIGLGFGNSSEGKKILVDLGKYIHELRLRQSPLSGNEQIYKPGRGIFKPVIVNLN
jgi:hypothetical protein